MMQINTNIPSMVSARVLDQQNTRLSQSLTRLGTGLRINNGKDDPAGMIASERLRSEIGAIEAARYNIGRANNVIASAEGGLDEVSNLLTDLESLIDKSANEAGISDDERDAYQLEIDAILDSINRIASSTEFQGRKLLDGEFDYTTSSISDSLFSNVRINSAKVNNDSYRSVTVEVAASAQLAALSYGASASGSGTTTIEVSGVYGTETLSFASGSSIETIADAVNQSTSLTGVSAVVTGGSELTFYSSEYGSDKFVSVDAIEGTFGVTGGDAGSTKDYGRDATVNINGVQAVTDGLRARLQSSTLGVEIELSESFGTSPQSTTFQITGGGADFMISPTVSLSGLASMGIQAVSTSSLGTGRLGYLSSLGSGQTNSISSGNFESAQRILREAQTQVSELRGRIGAFQKDTLDTTDASLAITLENITAAESAIRDTDFAAETSSMTRAQILVQSATSVLQIANQQPQQALALLG